ncbi:unnamed protein product [Haemonchus placei]|uniref:COesterase domain-containing protein n=1 Tax=Haemonchus placei TaxID=6290 RepID=A0A0N4VSF2_HAEPC|nr:unnamed protein product [Haemonchus placei]
MYISVHATQPHPYPFGTPEDRTRVGLIAKHVCRLPFIRLGPVLNDTTKHWPDPLPKALYRFLRKDQDGSRTRPVEGFMA